MFDVSTINPQNDALLKTHHFIEVEVYIMDKDQRYLFNMTESLVSGVVDIDVDADASRKGKMALLDPQQRLTIDFNGSGFGSNMSNRLVQIIYRVTSMDKSRTYACPIFTGPITKAKRDGVLVNMEFAGMEILLQSGMLHPYTWPPGWLRSNIVENAAIIFAGLPFPGNTTGGGGAVGSPWSVEAGENLWERLKDLGDAGGFNIFFDGSGRLQMRNKSTAPVMILDSTWLTEEPDLDLDTTKLRNVVRVEGATIPGTEVKMFYEAWPPPQHPFSPQSLARGAWLRVIPHHIRDNNLATYAELAEVAWNNLAWDLMVGESTTAVSAVIPYLEEYDVICISHPKVWTNSPLTKATIPLVGDAEMSLNFHSTTSSGVSRGPGVNNARKAQLAADRASRNAAEAARGTSRGSGITKGVVVNAGKPKGITTGQVVGEGKVNKGKKKKNRGKR